VSSPKKINLCFEKCLREFGDQTLWHGRWPHMTWDCWWPLCLGHDLKWRYCCHPICGLNIIAWVMASYDVVLLGTTLFRLWPKYNGIIVAILFGLTNLISNDSQLIREACFTCILVISIFDNYIIFEVFKLQARLTLL
jgi:hypothetical protein